jgi:hypothetical protein
MEQGQLNWTLPETLNREARMIRNVLAFIFVWAFALSTQGHAQVLRCIEDSPERRGQPGCSVVVEKRLPAPPTRSKRSVER